MKNSKLQWCLLALTVSLSAFFTSCVKEKVEPVQDAAAPEAVTSRSDNGPSANGQGALSLDYMNFETQHFAFHANTNSDGTVTGSWESKSPGQDGRAHGTIDCLTILPDGKTAIMSGVITDVQGEGYYYSEYFIGTTIWFKVRDNGEGANAEGDLFSDYFSIEFNCTQNPPFPVTLYPIDNGNIQVKP